MKKKEIVHFSMAETGRVRKQKKDIFPACSDGTEPTNKKNYYIKSIEEAVNHIECSCKKV